MNYFKDVVTLHEYTELLRSGKVKNVKKHYKKISKEVFGGNIKPGTLSNMENVPETFKGVKYDRGNWHIATDYTTLKYDVLYEAGLT